MDRAGAHWGIGGAPVVAVAVVGLLHAPAVAGPVAVAIIAAIVFLRRPEWLVPALVLVSFTALPAAIPLSVGAAGVTISAFEILLVFATVWASTRFGTARGKLQIFMFSAVAAYGVMIGVAMGADWGSMLTDARRFILLVLGVILGVAIAGTPVVKSTVKVWLWSLWLSVAFVAAAVVTGLPLHGRTEVAGLFIDGVEQAADANRYLTSATHAALAAACVCVALLLSGRARFRTVMPYLIPAAFLVLVSFSRNSFLALAAAVLFTLLFLSSRKVVTRSLGLLAGAAAIAGFLALVVAAVPDMPFAEWVTAQSDAFITRVWSGFDASTLTRDASTQYRDLETSYLLTAWQQAPIIGNGFGFAYKPPAGKPGGFEATFGTMYAHNFYLWLLVKAGIVGVVLLTLALWRPLFVGLGTADAGRVAAVAGAVSLLAVSVVAPIPLGDSSWLLGAFIGVAAAVTPTRVAPPLPIPVSRAKQFV